MGWCFPFQKNIKRFWWCFIKGWLIPHADIVSGSSKGHCLATTIMPNLTFLKKVNSIGQLLLNLFCTLVIYYF
jgi:hypothetical protein